jgi:hypothetical protein
MYYHHQALGEGEIPGLEGKIDFCGTATMDGFDYSGASPAKNPQRDFPSGATSPNTFPDDIKMRPLPASFVPGPFDVICGRWAKVKQHRGNVLFRKKIQDAVMIYDDANCKLNKSLVVSSVVDFFRHQSEGGFVKENGGVWYAVSEYLAREKTGQAFRDQLSHRYRSATKAKRRRWREETLNANEKTWDISPRTPEDHVHVVKQSEENVFFDELVGKNVPLLMQIRFLLSEKVELDRQQVQHNVPDHVYESHLEGLFTRNNRRLLLSIQADTCIHKALRARGIRARAGRDIKYGHRA